MGQLQDSDHFEILDKCLQNSNDDTHKLERLLVNRTHMKLIFSVNEQGTIEENPYRTLRKIPRQCTTTS